MSTGVGKGDGVGHVVAGPCDDVVIGIVASFLTA